MADFPRPIKNLIAAFERLPGIGPKSAVRLVFYLLNTPRAYTDELSEAVKGLKENIKTCYECFNVGEGEICEICGDSKRKKNLICVVERVIDLMTIENVGGFHGVYHVLGGAINPLDHIGPEDLKIAELVDKVRELAASNAAADNIEIILAMNQTMEGEATALYIKNQISKLGLENVKLSRIGSGLPMGADLEFADQATISRAMEGRREI